MTPSTLLHPLKLDVVGFQEEEHDYHFRVELPEPKCCESCGTIHNLVKFGKDDQADRLRRADFNRDALDGRRRALVRNQPVIPNTLFP